MDRVALYRHFDASGHLLYVGITRDTMRRLCQHEDRSRWMHRVARIEVEWFDDRSSALGAESRAIVDEHPMFNLRRPQGRDEELRWAVVSSESGCADGWYVQHGDAIGVLDFFREKLPDERLYLLCAARGQLPRLGARLYDKVKVPCHG